MILVIIHCSTSMSSKSSTLPHLLELPEYLLGIIRNTNSHIWGKKSWLTQLVMRVSGYRTLLLRKGPGDIFPLKTNLYMSPRGKSEGRGGVQGDQDPALPVTWEAQINCLHLGQPLPSAQSSVQPWSNSSPTAGNHFKTYLGISIVT